MDLGACQASHLMGCMHVSTVLLRSQCNRLTACYAQDAFLAIDGGAVMPTLLGMATGAQAVDGLLVSSSLNASSFNMAAIASFWTGFSSAAPGRFPLPPITAGEVRGISSQEVNSSYGLGLSLSHLQAAAPHSVQLMLNASLYDVEPSAALPFTQIVTLQQGLLDNIPLAVTFTLAGQL